MKQRLFTRRRHVISIRRRLLRLLIWLCAPVLAFGLGHHLIAVGAITPLAIGLVAVFAMFYSVVVLALRNVTGEWQFY
ncbi:MAG: hypothetical protein HOL85_15200 [Rhodospirillaceae bacterium]|nr:hypothetical protein [Rhodospirillaceae bacterium]MBT6137546.1 hypothetical protein [Rhodospirillaceae bacterium]